MTMLENVENENVPTINDKNIDPHFDEHDPEENLEDKSKESRFKEGQILKFVRVRFPGNAKSFSFLVGKRTIDYGQKVVAMSDRGMAVGYVNSFPYEVPFHPSMLPIRSIAKVASDEDIEKDKEAYRQQKEAEILCNDLIEQYKLDMQLTHVEFTSFGKKAVFYFIAPARVDFRDLVKDLVGKLKTRIELRQISVRDRSASIGGIGPCGRELCCSSFLTKYGNTGIKMAKNQDLTLNFSKLNGVCGQLKCCLQYEDEVYKEKRNHLPRENDIISTKNGDIAKVTRLHILSEQFEVITSRGVRKRFVAEMLKDILDREHEFPKEFDSISDETHKVIGLEDAEATKTKKFESEIQNIKNQSKSFAEKTFESLFGEKSLDYSLPQIKEPDELKTKILNPEEEDEIRYTPTDDEIFLDDEDRVFLDDEPIRTRTPVEARPQRAVNEMSTKGSRPQRSPEPRERTSPERPRHHQGPRTDSRNARPPQRREDSRQGRNDHQGRPQESRRNQPPSRSKPPRER
jgi:cell fate regulator YaaT (PSP1 superfamily)